jgi:hypothetical protein
MLMPAHGHDGTVFLYERCQSLRSFDTEAAGEPKHIDDQPREADGQLIQPTSSGRQASLRFSADWPGDHVYADIR